MQGVSKLNFTTRKQTKKRGNILRTVGLVLSKRWHQRSGRRLGKRNSVAEKGLRDITNAGCGFGIVIQTYRLFKKKSRKIKSKTEKFEYKFGVRWYQEIVVEPAGVKVVLCVGKKKNFF